MGITHVFDMVGHANFGFADEMHRAERRGDHTYIGVRHEVAAAFATSAFGKLTARPTVCFAFIRALTNDGPSMVHVTQDVLLI